MGWKGSLGEPFASIPGALNGADLVRRTSGRLLDAMSLGPIETPARSVCTLPGVELRAYGAAGDFRSGSAAPVLIVPAPIKRAYIWDLAPDASVVRRCLAAGLQVYLLRWTEAHRTADWDQGLEAYAD